MSGSGRVIKIEDPATLIKVDLDSLPLSWKEKRFKGMSRFEIYKKLSNQGQTLVDTVDYTFSLFFQFDQKDYLIYSGGNRTYLGEISDGKIEVLDTLMEKGSWSNSDIPSEIVDNIYHYRFLRIHGTGTKHMYSSGDIYVKQDTIVIGYVYKEWPRKEG